MGYQIVSPLRDNRSHSCEFLMRLEGLGIQMAIPENEGRRERSAWGLAAIGSRRRRA